jgi:hypothetical protein
MSPSRKWWLQNPNEPGQVLVPLLHQWDFARSGAYATFLAGGWGSAKSVGLLFFLSLSAFINPPRTAGMVVLPTWPLLEEFLDTQLLPAFEPIITGHSRGKRCLTLIGNRRLLYRSGHVPERLEMSNLSYLGADEVGLMDPSIFLRAVARIRDKRAKALRIGLTGVPYWGWLKDEFEGRNDSKRRIIHVSTGDNEHLHPEAMENLLAACPARLRSQYIEGLFVTPGGTVYPEFEHSRHVIPWQIQNWFDIGCLIDWSPRTPCVLWVQLIPEGTIMPEGPIQAPGAVIIDELHPDGSEVAVTTERLCQLVKAKGYPVRWFCCDPAGVAVEATSGMEQIAIARRELNIPARYTTNARKRNIQNGIENVKRLLDPLQGPPLLYFSDQLVTTGGRDPRATLNAVPSYAYAKPKGNKPLDSNPVKDGITDHVNDCIRYLSVNFFPSYRLQTRVRSVA